MDDSKLYYECHITIEPVFDDRFLNAKDIANSHGFRIADLLMKKRCEDTEVRSKHDTFMTGRSKNYKDLHDRMVACIVDLKENEFQVWRYKIEDTLLDSKFEDNLKLLDERKIYEN